MSSRLSVAGGALRLGFFASSLTIATLAARLATADVSPDALVHAEARALAARTHGLLTNDALRALIDGQSEPLFNRFDPGARRAAELSAVHPFESAAPALRLFQLPPASAQAVNASLPFSLDINPPARPFVFKGSAQDRSNALICLTQAVYYEAGFEPAAGEQAVAQVVLNRMRHPIFPHSVCGVVYQGAAQKTGCQFSFTCDGSLAKTPQPAAWDRARDVAELALNGYVMKAVGGATHYHTQWVVPWWQPTVSKVAQVGAHIFYRWQGGLGLPGAFNVRYAGDERIAPSAATPELSQPVVLVGSDGENRVQSVIQLADVAVVAPHERVTGVGKGKGSPESSGETGSAPATPETNAAAALELQAPKLDLKLDAPHVVAAPAARIRTASVGCMSAACARW